MLIRLDLIKPSPHPIRSSWDEDKMTELAQSIKEQGVIVPIKVRPTERLKECQFHNLDWIEDWQKSVTCEEPCFWCTEYRSEFFEEDEETGEDKVIKPGVFEVVYGHRRVEAARRAGLYDIPAIVEGVDDTDALVQALIENVQREDMSVKEKAYAIRRLRDKTGWSLAEIERQGIVANGVASHWLLWLEEYEAGSAVRVDTSLGPQDEGFSRTLEIRRQLGDNVEAKRQVAQKVGKEGLSRFEAREVAQTFAAAQDDAERQAILETDYHDPAFDRLVRVKSEVKRERKRQERKKREEEPREVAQYLKAVQVFTDAIHEAVAVAEYGKFSPEASRFVKGWHDSVRGLLAKLEQAMEDHNAKVQEQGG